VLLLLLLLVLLLLSRLMRPDTLLTPPSTALLLRMLLLHDARVGGHPRCRCRSGRGYAFTAPRAQMSRCCTHATNAMHCRAQSC
jgi:hypothetical protein